MTILGIDPGLAKTGWGLVAVVNQHLKLIDYGTIITKPGEKLESRIHAIVQEFEIIQQKYNPTDISIEDIFFFKNVSSAIPIAKVIGALCSSALRNKLKIEVFTPLQIKTALTGMGRADKRQIQEMIRVLLNLEKIPKPDHASDAIAAAICYYNHTAVNNRLGIR